MFPNTGSVCLLVVAVAREGEHSLVSSLKQQMKNYLWFNLSFVDKAQMSSLYVNLKMFGEGRVSELIIFEQFTLQLYLQMNLC
jgi:hypothetical protein